MSWELLPESIIYFREKYSFCGSIDKEQLLLAFSWDEHRYLMVEKH